MYGVKWIRWQGILYISESESDVDGEFTALSSAWKHDTVSDIWQDVSSLNHPRKWLIVFGARQFRSLRKAHLKLLWEQDWTLIPDAEDQGEDNWQKTKNVALWISTRE